MKHFQNRMQRKMEINLAQKIYKKQSQKQNYPCIHKIKHETTQFTTTEIKKHKP